MNFISHKRLLLVLAIIVSYSFVSIPQWGFFGHRLINKFAVFTLPTEIISFYKSNIEYIEEHAVDPDKRRYATKHEGARHYIDIDVWGTYPFENVPRDLEEALLKFAHYSYVSDNEIIPLEIDYSDTDSVIFNRVNDDKRIPFIKGDKKKLIRDFKLSIIPIYYEDEWKLPISQFQAFENTTDLDGDLVVEDHFSKDGILPYNLLMMKDKLTRAFKYKNKELILRLSAEIGHYIGDAHVPLHTTVNYNGQLTDQVGIHGFWESRIPELFALKEYNFMVGKADYILDSKKYFWGIVLESHEHLEEVLKIEKELSKSFPEDKQYCYDDRLNVNIRTYCPEYAKAYHKALQGMVEDRMTAAIKSIGSVWYTCWVDAGSPDLSTFGKVEIEEKEIIPHKNNIIKARAHE